MEILASHSAGKALSNYAMAHTSRFLFKVGRGNLISLGVVISYNVFLLWRLVRSILGSQVFMWVVSVNAQQ